MVLPWDFHGAPRTFNDIITHVPWDFRGTFAGFPWDAHGISMPMGSMASHGASENNNKMYVGYAENSSKPKKVLESSQTPYGMKRPQARQTNCYMA